MKVCFISHSEERGGGELSLLELIDALSQRGVQCMSSALPRSVGGTPCQARRGDGVQANNTLYGQVTMPFGGAIFNDSAVPFGMNNRIINMTTTNTGGPGSDCAVFSGITGNRDRSDNCFIGGINLGVVSNLDTNLQNNGGPTETHRLLAGSNAIDQGFNDCQNPDTNAPLVYDQRKILRPQDGNGDGTPQCDIGAYEYIPYVKPSTASSQQLP